MHHLHALSREPGRRSVAGQIGQLRPPNTDTFLSTCTLHNVLHILTQPPISSFAHFLFPSSAWFSILEYFHTLGHFNSGSAELLYIMSTPTPTLSERVDNILTCLEKLKENLEIPKKKAEATACLKKIEAMALEYTKCSEDTECILPADFSENAQAYLPSQSDDTLDVNIINLVYISKNGQPCEFQLRETGKMSRPKIQILDALATLLHHWRPALLPSVIIEEKSEAESVSYEPYYQGKPILRVERFGCRIAACYGFQTAAYWALLTFSKLRSTEAPTKVMGKASNKWRFEHDATIFTLGYGNVAAVTYEGYKDKASTAEWLLSLAKCEPDSGRQRDEEGNIIEHDGWDGVGLPPPLPARVKKEGVTSTTFFPDRAEA